MNVFTERLRLAADAIEEHGWTQGAGRNSTRDYYERLMKEGS